jgi:hypothetical protein
MGCRWCSIDPAAPRDRTAERARAGGDEECLSLYISTRFLEAERYDEFPVKKSLHCCEMMEQVTSREKDLLVTFRLNSIEKEST